MIGEVFPEAFPSEGAEVFDVGGEIVVEADDAEVETMPWDSDTDSDLDSMMMEGWINLWGNDQLRKRVLHRGLESTKPEEGYVCQVNMVGCLKDGTTFDVHEPLSVQVGDAEVVLGIDVVLMSMDVGEKALVEVGPGLGYGTIGRVPDVPPNSALIYLLELISAAPPPNITIYTTEELGKIGTRKRDRGNWWYSRQELLVALGCYQSALHYLGVDRRGDDAEDILMDERLKVYNNMAAIHLKMENYDVALDEINYVIEHQPDNVKALFRKGKVLSARGQRDEAIDVLTHALSLDPSNNAARTLFNTLCDEAKKDSQEVKRLYTKMLGGAEPSVASCSSTAVASASTSTTTTAAATPATTPATPHATTTTPEQPVAQTAAATFSKAKLKTPGAVHAKRKSVTLKSRKWGVLFVVSVAAVTAGLVAYRYKNNLM